MRIERERGAEKRKAERKLAGGRKG